MIRSIVPPSAARLAKGTGKERRGGEGVLVEFVELIYIPTTGGHDADRFSFSFGRTPPVAAALLLLLLAVLFFWCVCVCLPR